MIIDNHQPEVTLITCTGDRPEAFALCERWMAQQTFEGSVQWIVVDDGKTPSVCRLGQQHVRREPNPHDRRHTLPLNMQTAIPYACGEKILIVEDDDYYRPSYVETMSAMLDTAELAGQTHSIYYRLKTRQWKYCDNHEHASLFQTGCRASVLPTLSLVSQNATILIDQQLWYSWTGTKILIPGKTERLSIGIKQMPGRRGRTSGWGRGGRHYKRDRELNALREFVGEDFIYFQPYV